MDSIYIKFGASEQVYGGENEEVDEIERQASLAGLKLIKQEVRHMGTDKCLETLQRMRKASQRQNHFPTKNRRERANRRKPHHPRRRNC